MVLKAREAMAPTPAQATAPKPGIDAALRGLMAPQFLDSERFQEQQWRANRKGAHPSIVLFEKALILDCARLGIPMFAHNMVRTEAEQNALYVKGVTKAKGLDGPHTHGMAVDIVHSTKAWELTDVQWAAIGHLGKERAKQANIRITWGGDWKFYDPAHWELTDWRKLSADRQGEFDIAFWSELWSDGHGSPTTAS